jgi:separase
MATKNETTRTRIDRIKADLRSTTTCTNATATALQDLLAGKEEDLPQKENIRVKVQATARRRGATATATTTADVPKQKNSTLAPKEKYILATEVANTTLQILADALKNPPPATAARPPTKSKPTTAEDARKPARPRPGHTTSSSVSQKPLRERSVSQLNNSPQKRVPRRSSSYSSFLSPGPDPGLLATAECARIAFAYLGTPEAQRVLGKDSQELQYENGVLVLIGKLVALGLDNMAVKELRGLKKKLDKYLGHDSAREESKSGLPQQTTEKESVASLLDFGTIDSKSSAVPLVVNLQIYTLRIIAKLKRPRTIEATWEYLKMTNPSSPVNLLWQTAKASNGQAKAARQLESLAQTILSLCPSISSAEDANNLHPSAETVLLLQHLAFSTRKKWWGLAKHQANVDRELLEPFSKCLVAFARRSKLIPSKKFKLAETLYIDLAGLPTESTTPATANKALSSLAQAAGLSDQALRWLGSSKETMNPDTSAAKQTIRAIRIATINLEAYVKDEKKPDLEETIATALDVLQGGLGGSVSDLETLFAEVNALRRAATRLLITSMSKTTEITERTPIEQRAVPIIAASVHFFARFLGTASSSEPDTKSRNRQSERIALAWKCAKSTVDSLMACCKQAIKTQDQWQELDTILQEGAHIMRRLDEEIDNGTLPDGENTALVGAYVVKLSNAYWTLCSQLRRARCSPEILVVAMQRSIDLLQSRTPSERESGLLFTKLEHLGEALQDLDHVERSRNAFRQCISSLFNGDTLQKLSMEASTSSLHNVFGSDGSFDALVRVLKTLHYSFIKNGPKKPDELAFYDNDELEPAARGAILELQLSLYLRTLSKNRQWDLNLNMSICTIVEQLQQLYVPVTYPIRSLRLSVTLLQLSQQDPQILSQRLTSLDVTNDEGLQVASSEDEGLKRYEVHLKALRDLKSSMQQASPPIKAFQQSCAAWESLVSSVSSWEALIGRVDNTEIWLQDLQACLEFLNAKGEEYIALPLLHLLVKILELQNSSDASVLIVTLSALGLQFLHLGYTGQAGLSLAKAETLVENHTSSVEARLQWHMAYAEYLVGIGNSAKWYVEVCAISMDSY